jgi:hypothetical protein
MAEPLASEIKLCSTETTVQLVAIIALGLLLLCAIVRALKANHRPSVRQNDKRVDRGRSVTVPEESAGETAAHAETQASGGGSAGAVIRSTSQIGPAGTVSMGSTFRRPKQASLPKEGGTRRTKGRSAKSKRREITVETVLGSVTIDNRHGHPVAIIGLGQDETHLRWYYDVYQKEILQRAVRNLNDCARGKKNRSSWNGGYFDFIQNAPTLLAGLAEQRDSALRDNLAKIERKEIQILGTYASTEQATTTARYLRKKREPTLNAGWLNVHVVPLPQESDTCPAAIRRPSVVPKAPVEQEQTKGEWRTFYIRVAGVTYPNADGSDRQSIVARCMAGERVLLAREPDNPHDRLAVRVVRCDGQQVGYLPSQMQNGDGARWSVATGMDAGYRYRARVAGIGGGGSQPYGMSLLVTFWEGPLVTQSTEEPEL